MTIWENIGRSVGYGLEKAKELGEHLTDRAENRMELRAAEHKLSELHLALGQAIAKHVGTQGEVKELDLEPFASLLQDIATADRAVAEAKAAWEKQKAEEEKKAAEEAAAKAKQDPSAEQDSPAEQDPSSSSSDDATRHAAE